MTVYELMDMFMEKDFQRIEIYNLATDEVEYSGMYMDITDEYDDAEVCSVDNLTTSETLVINVDM